VPLPLPPRSFRSENDKRIYELDQELAVLRQTEVRARESERERERESKKERKREKNKK
jgi:hypothetical protein